MWAKLNEKRSALERWAEHLDQVILKGRGREIARQAISTARTYEGWNAWASVGRLPLPPKPRETWDQRKARLEGEGRDLVAEHRTRQAALRRSRRPREPGR
jgi:hypothetical protein